MAQALEVCWTGGLKGLTSVLIYFDFVLKYIYEMYHIFYADDAER